MLMIDQTIIRTIICCLIAGSMLSEKCDAADSAFNIKDYKLGMTLDALKIMPYPGGRQAGYLLCQPGVLHPRSQMESKRAQYWTNCEYRRLGMNGGMVGVNVGDLNSCRGLPVTVAGKAAVPTFHFIWNGKESQLYSAQFVTDSSNFEPIKDALIAKYGKPTRSKTFPYKLSNVSENNESDEWENLVSTLSIEKFGASILNSNLWIVDKKLQALSQDINNSFEEKEHTLKNQQAKDAANDL